jgi:hypothetical protein
MGYFRSGAPGIFPPDRALTLPARSFSYELQRRLVKAAVQNPFLDSVQTTAELTVTGVSVSKRSLEQILPDAAQDFDAFYRRSPEPSTGSILVAAVDCKGIPMVKPGAQPTPGLSKGQKANKKRMATVATVFTRAPWVRTPQQVVESLFRICRPTPEDAPAPPRPENKRVWARVLKLRKSLHARTAPLPHAERRFKIPGRSERPAHGRPTSRSRRRPRTAQPEQNAGLTIRTANRRVRCSSPKKSRPNAAATAASRKPKSPWSAITTGKSSGKLSPPPNDQSTSNESSQFSLHLRVTNGFSL